MDMFSRRQTVRLLGYSALVPPLLPAVPANAFVAEALNYFIGAHPFLAVVYLVELGVSYLGSVGQTDRLTTMASQIKDFAAKQEQVLAELSAMQISFTRDLRQMFLERDMAALSGMADGLQL